MIIILISGGRGLIRVEECVRAEERELAYYVEPSTEALLIAVTNEEGLNDVNEAPKAFREIERLKHLMNREIKSYMAKF